MSLIDDAIKLSAEYLATRRKLSKTELILLVKALLEEIVEEDKLV